MREPPLESLFLPYLLRQCFAQMMFPGLAAHLINWLHIQTSVRGTDQPCCFVTAVCIMQVTLLQNLFYCLVPLTKIGTYMSNLANYDFALFRVCSHFRHLFIDKASLNSSSIGICRQNPCIEIQSPFYLLQKSLLAFQHRSSAFRAPTRLWRSALLCWLHKGISNFLHRDALNTCTCVFSLLKVLKYPPFDLL